MAGEQSGETAGGRSRWTFERWVAVCNLAALLVGATLAAIDWWPQYSSHRAAAAAASETPTVPSSRLSIRDVQGFPHGSRLYDVVYDVATKNNAAQPVTITYSIAELYVGVRAEITPALHQGYPLNDMPTPWDASGTGGLVWTRAGYDASWVDGGPPVAVKNLFAARHLEDRSDGGGLTGSLAPGDSTATRVEFFVRARPGEYLGVVVSYGIGAAVRSPSPNINLTSDFARAPDPPAVPKKSADAGPSRSP